MSTRAGAVTLGDTARQLLDTSADALLVVDEHGAIVFANAQAARRFRATPEELLGRPICDVTDRERVEASLRRSEEHLARAQRVAHLGSWEWDFRTNEVWRSDGFFAIFGVPPDREHVRPFSFTDRIPAEELPLLQRTIADARARGGGYTLEHHIRRADGELRFVVQRGDTLVEDGQPARMVGTMLDITERKRAERDLEVTTRRLRAVLEQAPVGIVMFEGDRAEPNGRAVTLLGRRFDPSRGIEQSVGYILTTDGRVVPRDELPGQRALRGERVEAEMIVQTPEGRRVPVLVTAAPIVGDRGEIEGSVLAFEDITSLKDLERLRAEWSSVVAHDLRQPLNAIALYARLLRRRAADVSELLEAVESIEHAARRLDRMIGDLSDVSRLEARRLALVRRPCDVGVLVRAAGARLEIETPERPARVQVEDGLPPVLADADRVSQVLENLVTNAVKYGRAGTSIVLDARRAGEHVAVSVTNEGAGIPAEELPTVFERFRRTQDAARGPQKGLGLGLYIARELVEAHGGRIVAESTPGETTTFRFTLPIAS